LGARGKLTAQQYSKAQWRSWLARRPVTAKVAGSSPVWVANEPGGSSTGLEAR
jgi:hypothetical protein